MEYNLAKPTWWIRPILFMAFLYNLVWGIATIFFPEYVFRTASLELPTYLFIWQTLGAVEVVMAFGYLIAIINPYRHWSPVALGLVFKLLSAAIFFNAAIGSAALSGINNYIFIDDLIWLLPFAAILTNVYRRSFRSDELMLEAFDDEMISWDMFDTSEGITLQQMADQQPTMVVFLRHFGCTFCREALCDLSKQREAIEANGVRILLVHMLEDNEEARRQIVFYGWGKLNNLPMLSDPEGMLYKKFKLRRGTFWQLLGGKVLIRGIIAGIFKYRGLGKEMGDMMQMPGLFVIYQDKILKKFVHKSSADRPPYIKLATLSKQDVE